MPTRLAETLRRLHAGPRFRDDFDMFRLSRALPRPRRRARHPDPGRATASTWTGCPRIEAALARHPLAPVPCHNDLLADNVLSDGTRLWIVDYEYSGMNDPAFELGNTCQELGYTTAQVAELCRAYFGEATPALLARMRLQMIMSDVGWTLWAAIQARISTIDYDFGGWAEERWARATAMLDGPDFGDLAGRGLTVPRADRAPDAGSARPRRDAVAPRWRGRRRRS